MALAPLGQKPLARITARLVSMCSGKGAPVLVGDSDADLLLDFADATDALVQESLMRSLGRRSDSEGAADKVFRIWIGLPPQLQEQLAKLALEENAVAEFEAVVGQLPNTEL